MQYVFFFGSHPALSAAEVLNVLRREHIPHRVAHAHARYLIIDSAAPLPTDLLSRLGGSERVARVLASQPAEWQAAEIAAAVQPAAGGKFMFGLNVWPEASGETADKLARELKAAWREQGYSARFTSPKRAGATLNAAQVIFNRLHELPNLDLHLLRAGEHYAVAQTVGVQDIQAYEQRDTARPARDARVGMLPPKVAQIMLNLVPEFSQHPPTVYDPFCGTGTVLQEGLLLGWRMVGSDASPDMVAAAQQNLAWLAQHPLFAERLQDARAEVYHHDARRSFPAPLHGKVDAIVTEPYLGTPLTRPLSPAAAAASFGDIQQIYLSFFAQAREVLAPGGWIVFVLPALKVTGQQEHALFPAGLLDRIGSLGYSRKQPVAHAVQQAYASTERGTLLYSRPDALVAREITVWKKR